MTIAIDTEGAHPATHLCLEALQWLHERRAFVSVLDMGCGNGILSVAAVAIWDTHVLAVDISPRAISDAQVNVEAHHMQDRVMLLRSDGFSERTISKLAPYDLIIFNLLAESVVEMARQVKAHLAPGGFAIIGGLLEWKAAGVEETYVNLGFEIIQQFTSSPWKSLLVRLPET